MVGLADLGRVPWPGSARPTSEVGLADFGYHHIIISPFFGLNGDLDRSLELEDPMVILMFS